MLPRLVYGAHWEDCDTPIKELVNKELQWREFLSENESDMGQYIQPPSAVLLFEYYHDIDELKEIYMTQNPEATDIIIETIKFLPENLLYLIKDKKLLNCCMFILFIVY